MEEDPDATHSSRGVHDNESSNAPSSTSTCLHADTWDSAWLNKVVQLRKKKCSKIAPSSDPPVL